MKHDKYLEYGRQGMPLDEILTRFEADLLIFLADIEDDFEATYVDGDGL